MLPAKAFWSGLEASGVKLTDQFTPDRSHRYCRAIDGELFIVPVFESYPCYMVDKVLNENSFTSILSYNNLSNCEVTVKDMAAEDSLTPASRIHEIVNELPVGKVVTYGSISKKVYGRTNCGPAVGAAIKSEALRNPDDYPWWRVVGSTWRPRLQDREGQRNQIDRLKREGVEVLEDGRVAHSSRHCLDE